MILQRKKIQRKKKKHCTHFDYEISHITILLASHMPQTTTCVSVLSSSMKKVV